MIFLSVGVSLHFLTWRSVEFLLHSLSENRLEYRIEKILLVMTKTHPGKPDFHGSSAASLVDPTSVMKFMDGLLSITTPISTTGGVNAFCCRPVLVCLT